MNRKRWTSCILLLALVCAMSSALGEAISFEDDLGRSVTLEAQPQRVAAMIGSFADIWCLAGGKDALVCAANDTWTSFDLDLDESVVNLGGVSEPSVELLFAADPDFVLASCNTQANLDMQASLEDAGISTAYFDIQNYRDYLRMLKICCEITGQTENYATYGEAVEKRIDAAVARQDGSAPTVLCVRATGVSCKAKGSQNNLLGGMLADLGCVNIADGDSGLLENLTMEAIVAADPEYIFVVLQGADSAKAEAMLEETLLSNPAWSGLTAVREGRFYTLDNQLYNLKPNARWGEAYEKLADILYGAVN